MLFTPVKSFMCLLSLELWIKPIALSNFISSRKQARNLFDFEPGDSGYMLKNNGTAAHLLSLSTVIH